MSVCTVECGLPVVVGVDVALAIEAMERITMVNNGSDRVLHFMSAQLLSVVMILLSHK